MAVPPNGYHKVRTSVMYNSPTHGKFILYRDHDAICANWEGLSWDDRKNVVVWRDGVFDDDNVMAIAQVCSDDAETMTHWIKEEVIKFASAFIPIEEV